MASSTSETQARATVGLVEADVTTRLKFIRPDLKAVMEGPLANDMLPASFVLGHSAPVTVDRAPAVSSLSSLARDPPPTGKDEALVRAACCLCVPSLAAACPKGELELADQKEEGDV